ncbi:MAG: STAS domain-containing protein [Verrucomicrobiae bacterium]|nr:STAS domain-containing protein [Verrucomicrobiae bacterium]
MTIEIQDQQGVLVARLTGRIDSTTAVETQTSLLQKVEGSGLKVVLDLGAVEYVSSAGLRTILAVAKKIQSSQGQVVAAAMQDQVREIFEIAGFDAIIKPHADVASAVAALRA